MENIHGLVGPQKMYSTWQSEVRKNFVNILARFVSYCNLYSHFSIDRCDARSAPTRGKGLAIQEAMCGFIHE